MKSSILLLSLLVGYVLSQSKYVYTFLYLFQAVHSRFEIVIRHSSTDEASGRSYHFIVKNFQAGIWCQNDVSTLINTTSFLRHVPAGFSYDHYLQHTVKCQLSMLDNGKYTNVP